MYSTMQNHLALADISLRWGYTSAALFFLSMAKRHAQIEHKHRAVGHILSAIKLTRRAMTWKPC